MVKDVFVRHSDRAIMVPLFASAPLPLTDDLVAHRAALDAASIADLGMHLDEYITALSKFAHVFYSARDKMHCCSCSTFQRDVNCAHQRVVRSLLRYESAPAPSLQLHDPSRKKKTGRPAKGSAEAVQAAASKAAKRRRTSSASDVATGLASASDQAPADDEAADDEAVEDDEAANDEAVEDEAVEDDEAADGEAAEDEVADE
jgi:hypothetical protein